MREALEMKIRDEREDAMLGTEKGIRVYVFEIGDAPNPLWNPVKARKEAEKIAVVLKGCEGLMSVNPVWPNTLAAFDTLNNAKIARNRMEAAGSPCGKNIMWGRWYKAENRIEIKGKAEE